MPARADALAEVVVSRYSENPAHDPSPLHDSRRLYTPGVRRHGDRMRPLCNRTIQVSSRASPLYWLRPPIAVVYKSPAKPSHPSLPVVPEGSAPCAPFTTGEKAKYVTRLKMIVRARQPDPGTFG